MAHFFASFFPGSQTRLKTEIKAGYHRPAGKPSPPWPEGRTRGSRCNIPSDSGQERVCLRPSKTTGANSWPAADPNFSATTETTCPAPEPLPRSCSSRVWDSPWTRSEPCPWLGDSSGTYRGWSGNKIGSCPTIPGVVGLVRDWGEQEKRLRLAPDGRNETCCSPDRGEVGRLGRSRTRRRSCCCCCCYLWRSRDDWLKTRRRVNVFQLLDRCQKFAW